MYNEERKLQYIKQKEDGVVLANNLRNAFDQFERFEEEYHKDICEWTSGEIIGFYKYLGTSYIQTLIQLHNALSSYANWCMINGLIKDNQNHFAEITSEMLCNCVDTTALHKLILSREEILSSIKELINFCDQFIILGLFEGIPVTDSVMKNVKLSDLDGNTLHLSNGRDLAVSDELVHIMRMADEEHDWISYSTKRKGAISYVEDGCIIRYTMRKNGIPYDMCSSTIVIGARLRRAVKFIGWPENITIKSIMESGRIHMMYQLAAEYNISVEDTINKPQIREIHEKIYGKIQNYTTYMNTYGSALN